MGKKRRGKLSWKSVKLKAESDLLARAARTRLAAPASITQTSVMNRAGREEFVLLRQASLCNCEQFELENSSGEEWME